MKKALLIFIAASLTSCQKTDVERCVDAEMDAFDERTQNEASKQNDNNESLVKISRKEWKSAMYQHCLAISSK